MASPPPSPPPEPSRSPRSETRTTTPTGPTGTTSPGADRRVTFTCDLEDHRRSAEVADTRYSGLTEVLLDQLDSLGAQGTFFVLGRIAEENPKLIEEISERGHEVALHSWDHTPLPELSPAQFRDHTKRGKELLEQLTGTQVLGYRAPVFSLDARADWAPEVLAELGFRYSSSVLPVRNPLYGWPEAPTTPFRWPSGVVELPCPVISGNGWGLPFLGGIYARLLPLALTQHLVQRSTKAVTPELLWLYCHPYDFDPDEPYWRVPDVGSIGSRLLWVNRDKMTERVDKLVGSNPGPPLAKRVADLPIDLPIFPTVGAPS